MDYFCKRNNLFYRFCSGVLITLHLVTLGPMRDTLAFTAQSTSYKLSSGAINEGGKSRSAASIQIWQDAIGESSIGKSQSANYILDAGFIPTVQSNPPILIQHILYQSWAMNSSKDNVFDLDDYFISPDGYPLVYSVSGNSNINIAIDPTTHMVSFSQPQDWYGAEKVYFSAVAAEGAPTQSNKVSLQVENSQGQDKPAIVDIQLTPAIIQEGNLITMAVKASDLDGDTLTFAYSDLFIEINRYQEGNLWVSEAVWQTGAGSKGHYNITVTATDSSSLSDTEGVLVNVGNFNHPPVLIPVADITANEGELVVINPFATDSDNDTITYYYSFPFDSSGKWLTSYDDAGTYTLQVTASDGIDTVFTETKVTVNNTNRPPQPVLTLSKYTVKPDEVFDISLSASDPDADSMSFSLQKDGTEIASGALTGIYTMTTYFSAIGDHTISATVTDSGGLSATDAKGVDAADPNANRDYINPVMGDFNGDALVDLGLHNSQAGNWEICISDAGVFRNAVDWLSGFGASRDWWPIGGDFNGDAKTDAGVYNITTGELKIALSSGSGFSVSGTWLTFSGASYSWQPFSGNFNADRYTDFALYNKDTGEVKIALGLGSGFGAFNTWLTGFGNDYISLSGDFNGDALSDLCLFKKSSGEFKVAFSDSNAFVDGQSWIYGFAVDKDPIISDFNNDGISDIGYWEKSGARWYYAISTGDRFIDKGLWLGSFGSTDDESGTTGDFDGNGITDAACFDKDQIGINRWAVKLSTDKPTGLLTEIDNGIGGKTQVTYTYAAESDNVLLPFPVYVASAISLVNNFPVGRAASYTQNFNFSGGYYDAAEREFRGFAKVKVTDPITNNYSETYFHQGLPGQDGALKGQIEKIIAYDGNARKISETINTYEIRKAGPQDKFLGFPALIEQNTTVWEENDTYLITKDKITYDNIGNVIEQLSEGDISKTGDEKSTAATYAQAYDVGFNRPLETVLKDKDGNIASKKSFEYDNKGNLTKDIAMLFNPLTGEQANSQTQYSYDSFGNLTSTINALGSVVTTDYETAFYTYPERVTNSLGHSVRYVYEPKFGAIKSTIDANGNISSVTYDSLARPLETKNAYDQVVVIYSYPDFNTKITTNAIGLSSSEYVDGLGRKYKTISNGEDGSSARDVSTETYFNSRGLTEKESLPHYLDEDTGQISYVRYEYDIRGRIKKAISDFPGTGKDAESSTNYINPFYTETADPQGHKKGALKDIYGNITEVTEFALVAYKTIYEYDVKNNLVKTTDSHGNIAEIFYDSFGRKTKMIDPDMGTWIYEYDLAGNLIKQTDAKGQILEFTYDALNRLASKLANGQTIVTYQYDETAKANCLGRLSKIIDQSGSTEFFYDKLGREIKSIKSVDGMAYSVEREYDILGRLVKLTYPDNSIVQYSYDLNSGLLERVTGSQDYIKDIVYNAQGQIKTTQYGNSIRTDYTYGQDLRLSRILTQGPAVLQDLNYIFDKNGNLTTLTDNLRSNIRTFIYDDLDRLAEARNVPSPQGGYSDFYYQYDPIGNMTYKSDVGVMTYGVNAGPHALTSAGGYTYQYDANGNMVSGKNKTITYDTENRLLEVNELGIITSFLYDGDGGRVKKTTGLNSTVYIGSLFEKDSNGKITKYIFAGANRVATVNSQTGSPANPQTYYYHSDHLGSSNIITDQAGQQAQYCEYTPYGTLARNEGSDIAKHKFTGKELDNTGLYFYGARYYDPAIGRFITADIIVQAPYDPQSLNRYSYCRNNPINYVDPTGHGWWKKFWNSFAGAFVGAVVTVLTTGAGAPLWLAGMYGGITGGALTGGLEGGSKGALIGGAMGGALGVFGGWGVQNFGAGFGVGMFAASAGFAGATNSWDSFTGGIAGGIVGATVGIGIVKSEQFQNCKAKNDNKYYGFQENRSTSSVADGNVNKTLIVDKSKGVSGDPIIDDPEVRLQILKAYNESLEKGTEQGGLMLRDKTVVRYPQENCLSDRVYPIFRPSAVADFHTHFVRHGPSPQDYFAARNNLSVYGLKHYVVDRQGIVEYAPDGKGLFTGIQKDVWKWSE